MIDMWQSTRKTIPGVKTVRGKAPSDEPRFDAEILVVEDPDGRKFNVLNPGETFTFKPYGRGYGGGGHGGLYVLWFGEHSPTLIAVFADGLEAALEEAASFAKDHWPGLLYDDEYINELFKEAKDELVAEGADPDDEDTDEKAQEKATADMTYTESGYIGSDEWGIWCDDGEGHACPDDLRDAILLAASVDAFEEARGLEDVADVVRIVRPLPMWRGQNADGTDWVEGTALMDDVPVFGDETSYVKQLLAPDSPHGELISWDTSAKNPWNHEYLFWRPNAPNERQRTVIVDHGDIFKEA